MRKELEAPPEMLAGEARGRAKERWRAVFDDALRRGTQMKDLGRIDMPEHLWNQQVGDLAAIQTYEGATVLAQKTERWKSWRLLNAALKREALLELEEAYASREAEGEAA